MTALGDDPLAAARLLHDMGRFELAAGAARRVLAERPDDPEAHSLLALALAGRGRQLAAAGAKGQAAGLADQATGAAREAVRLDPDAAGAWLALASVLG
jgi:Flp pilus assembly protein TadD